MTKGLAPGREVGPLEGRVFHPAPQGSLVDADLDGSAGDGRFMQQGQPSLPLEKGRCGTMTHDCKRHGTTSLFAVMNVADGTIISECLLQHRHHEWLRFLNLIKSEVPQDKQIHLVCGNSPPTSIPRCLPGPNSIRGSIFTSRPQASWLNMEHFFRDLSDKAMRHGSFDGVDDLIGAIEEYVIAHNDNPKPFIWTASANDIPAKVKGVRRAKMHYKLHAIRRGPLVSNSMMVPPDIRFLRLRRTMRQKAVPWRYCVTIEVTKQKALEIPVKHARRKHAVQNAYTGANRVRPKKTLQRT